MDKVYQMYRESLMTPQRMMDELGVDMDGDSLGMGVIRKEIDLTNEEKTYLLAVERGDVPSTRQFLTVAHVTKNINVNCVDPLGRTALLIAIENENIEMIELLLNSGLEVGDAVLHAINEENVEAVELILNHQILTKGEESLYTMEPSSSFTPDITPIILAAHRDNYEIIKILLDRGYRIPKPHDVRCSCKTCLTNSKEDTLRHSRSRINAYRALASPSLICLSSKDPILTSFELSWELKRLSRLENEFKADYEKLAKKCQDFAVDLLEQTRGSKELQIILNHDTSSSSNDVPSSESGGTAGGSVTSKQKLNRLKLAIKFKQKKFVAHPNCQQLLASLWYDGLPGFRRKNIICKLGVTFTIGFMFPILSVIYLIAPKSTIGSLIRKPFIKFISHSASYITFLCLLILVSNRVQTAVFPEDHNYKGKLPVELRGAPATTVEWMILAYVAGLVWAEIKQLWDEGVEEYIHNMWNILDFVTNSLYIATLTLRVIAYIQVKHERAIGQYTAYMERKLWDPYDPTLIAEVLFAGANIFSSLKLINIFTVNSHLGPLQISIGRMIIDNLKFAFVYFLVLFSFACGLNHLYWYYANLRQTECEESNHNHDSCDRKYRSFANLFEIGQSLYWAIYGLVDLDHAEFQEPHVFTQIIAKLMFGTYSYIAIVVLINMLIAMMSNSYQMIYSQQDEEWKFARSKLWISYFEDGATLPVPFNIIPSPKTFFYMLVWCKGKMCACSKRQKHSRWQSIKKIVKRINEKEIRYQGVMRDLIKRYIMQKQRGPEKGEGVTEDDTNEIKQDISSFRFELLEILRNNGMKMPNPNQMKTTNRRQSRKKGPLSLDRLKRTMSFEPGKRNAPGAKINSESRDLGTVVAEVTEMVRSQSSSRLHTTANHTSESDIIAIKALTSKRHRKPSVIQEHDEEEEEKRRESLIGPMSTSLLGKPTTNTTTPASTTTSINRTVLNTVVDVRDVHSEISEARRTDEGLGESLDQQSQRSTDSPHLIHHSLDQSTKAGFTGSITSLSSLDLRENQHMVKQADLTGSSILNHQELREAPPFPEHYQASSDRRLSSPWKLRSEVDGNSGGDNSFIADSYSNNDHVTMTHRKSD